MRAQIRAGFTMIELMVALALTMFLMIILTQCFVLSLETFSGMKGLGDMQQNLRSATTILATDLAEDHFEGKRRLSDSNIFNSALPIQAGYFAVKQGSQVVLNPAAPPFTTPYIWEGNDGNTIPSFRAADHALAFTVKRKGNRPDRFFTTALHGDQAVLTQFFGQSTAYNMLSLPNVYTWAPKYGGGGFPAQNATPPASPIPGGAPPTAWTSGTPDYATSTLTTPYVPGTVANPNNLGFYSSQWAEVYYYLVFTGTTEQPNNPNATLGTPIFSLYRAQFVMVPDSTAVNKVGFTNGLLTQGPPASPFAGLSCCPQAANPTVLFNSPTDVAYRTEGAAPNIVRRAVDMSVAVAPYSNADWRLNPGSGVGVSENTNVAAQSQTQGSTELVLPNVLSFQVQLLETNPNNSNNGATPGSNFVDLPPPGSANALYYDSSLLNAANAQFSIKAIRVTLRIWDNATRQTRQVSLTQDL